MKINTYDGIKKPTVKSTITIQEWFELIKNNKFEQKIESARLLDRHHPDYIDIKWSMPCVTYNFLFDGYREDISITTGTGLLYIDIDDQNFDMSNLDYSKVFGSYKSFGGKGYGILVKVSGMTLDNFEDFNKRVCQDLGIDKLFDKGGRKATQCSVLSSDKDAYLNTESSIYTFPNAINKSDRKKVQTEKVPSLLNIKTEERKEKHKVGMAPFGKLRLSNKLDFKTNDEVYQYFPEGVPVSTAWYSKKRKIDTGNRNAVISTQSKIVVNINKNVTYDKLYSHVSAVSQSFCKEPLDEKSIIKITNDALTNAHKYDFSKPQKFVFDPEVRLSQSERNKIMNPIIGADKKAQTIKSLKSIYIPGMKQKDLIDKSGKSPRTVKRHWQEVIK